MTTISAAVVCDSISEQGQRLTTLQLRYPRFIHSELMTHRAFSRNARSSRAVPIDRMIQECIEDPVVPLHWGAAQKGMQADHECDNLVDCWFYLDCPSGPYRHSVVPSEAWLLARDQAVEFAAAFSRAGYHKQVVNRILEPFLHIDVLVSATEWSNFFELRNHKDAEPHIRMLALEVKTAMDASQPRLLRAGDWHMPYISATDELLLSSKTLPADPTDHVPPAIQILRKISAARCARISYAPFNGEASMEAELKRFDLLVGSKPLHASPVEHIATPDSYIDPNALVKEWRHPELSRNYIGWTQYRAVLGG